VAYATHTGEITNAYKTLLRRHKKGQTAWDTCPQSFRWEDLRELDCDGAHSIQLAQNRDQWLDF